jgi:hypothetical protein
MAKATEHRRLNQSYPVAWNRARSRARSIWLTIWGVLLLGLANVWRAVGLGRQSELLRSLEVSLDPGLRLAAALFWALAFIGVAVALWQRRPIARQAVPGLLFVYALFQSALPLLFAVADGVADRLPLKIAFYGLAILFAGWALNRPANRSYFGDQ